MSQLAMPTLLYVLWDTSPTNQPTNQPTNKTKERKKKKVTSCVTDDLHTHEKGLTSITGQFPSTEWTTSPLGKYSQTDVGGRS